MLALLLHIIKDILNVEISVLCQIELTLKYFRSFFTESIEKGKRMMKTVKSIIKIILEGSGNILSYF